uniref:ABC transporter domain-containing protein n=1 Tax=uncultured bacterium contig00052 TaxID=1181536 RepID=A0A806JYU7_9BACT|nr:hypothetical protein [uncultured bacterium contig00052]
MVLSWVDLSIPNCIKPFSLGLEKADFLFLAGESHRDKLLRALAGFLPKESNSQEAIRVNGKPLGKDEKLDSLLLPKNMAQSLPPHRTIGQFALDISPNMSRKSLEIHAAKHGVDKCALSSKPSKIPLPMLHRISLWCAALFTSKAVFIEEPDGGFCEECRPFDFLQSMLINNTTSCIIFSPASKESLLQKARAMQFCRARIAVFCGDRLVEEGEAQRMLESPVHNYTKEWLDNGDFQPRKARTAWSYCKAYCEERNCPKHGVSSAMLDCKPDVLHKVMCRGFLD